MYDDLVKSYSEGINMDWKLVSSLICQESNFNPSVVSWSGARGLMQLMPATAKMHGITQLSNPEQNIKAGTRHLKFLNKLWAKEIENKDERMKFILASYNVGSGHVKDARRLAEKYGKNPDIWEDNVDVFLKQKSNPYYYKDPVVKYGYCRGSEPYKYVNEVLGRYLQYKAMIDKEYNVVAL